MKKKSRTLNITVLIAGIVMVASAFILLIVFQRLLGTEIWVEKLSAVLGIVGATMIGIKLKRLTEIKETSGEESDRFGDGNESKKRIKKMASLKAKICCYPLLFVACIVYILFVEPIWGLSLLIAGVCVLQFIIYRCLIVMYKRKSADTDAK